MVKPEILKRYGCTKQRIRVVATAKNDKLTPDGEEVFNKEIEKIELARGRQMSADQLEKGENKVSESEREERKEKFIAFLYKAREDWESKIEGRLMSGIEKNLRNYNHYMSADMAWEGKEVNGEIFSYDLFRQGKITFNECWRDLSEEAKKVLSPYYVKDKEGKVVDIATSRLTNVTVNLVKTYIRRRVAGQYLKYKNSPYFKYQSRSRSQVEKLRADALTQRVEMMTDQFGYRHSFVQNVRKMCLHSHCLTLLDGVWDKETQVVDGTEGAKPKVVREGVNFFSPHPTRVFCDPAYPLSSINHNNGISYVGYWDIKPFREIRENPLYYNLDSVGFRDDLAKLTETHPLYFNYYYNDAEAKVICPSQSIAGDVVAAESNRRDFRMSLEHDSLKDVGGWFTVYYEKVVPSEVGLGDYPHPVWIRLFVLNNKTIIYGEFIPQSRPGSYMGMDEMDDLEKNMSMANEIVPYNDQVVNFYNQLLHVMRLNSILITALNTDFLDEETINKVEKTIEGKAFYDKTHVLKYSRQLDTEGLGTDPTRDKPVELVRAEVDPNYLRELLEGIAQTISMVEKSQMFSPQELAQYSTGKKTAREVVQVASSTNSIYSYISMGPEEWRASQKEIIFESLIAFGSGKVAVSIPQVYPKDIVQKAGFVETEEGLYVPSGKGMTISGDISNLYSHDYLFSNRDGEDRIVDAESARTLADLTRYVFSNEILLKVFVQEYGMGQLTEILNQIFYLSGSDFVLQGQATEDGVKKIIGENGEQNQQALAQIVEKIKLLEENAIESNNTVAGLLNNNRGQQVPQEQEIPIQ